LLFAHASVAEVAVVGLPDDKWGETVGAFIRPAAGQSGDKQELFAYLREQLAPHNTPKQWIQVEQFPSPAPGRSRSSSSEIGG
jgi:acyl-coenzyme A synthetase/AMP-(fatty) acid ligase